MTELRLMAVKGDNDAITDVQIEYLDCDGCDEAAVAQAVADAIRGVLDNLGGGNGNEEAVY